MSSSMPSRHSIRVSGSVAEACSMWVHTVDSLPAAYKPQTNHSAQALVRENDTQSVLLNVLCTACTTGTCLSTAQLPDAAVLTWQVVSLSYVCNAAVHTAVSSRREEVHRLTFANTGATPLVKVFFEGVRE